MEKTVELVAIKGNLVKDIVSHVNKNDKTQLFFCVAQNEDDKDPVYTDLVMHVSPKAEEHELILRAKDLKKGDYVSVSYVPGEYTGKDKDGNEVTKANNVVKSLVVLKKRT